MRLPACAALLLALWTGTIHGACPPSTGCFPESGNIAFGRLIDANSTCGDPLELFDIATSGLDIEDLVCDAADPELAHPPSLANDNNQTTQWQARVFEFFATMQLNFSFPMRLEKSVLFFSSIRPDRMILEKSSDYGLTWTPYQFYSLSCIPILTRDGLFQAVTFKERNELPSDSIEAFCINDDTDGADGTVEFRAAKRFGNNRFDDETIIEHLVVTNLRARFRDLHTLGTEDILVPKTLQRYFYAVTEWNVTGHCYCSGHAETCVQRELELAPDGKILSGCYCQHNTQGVHCEECMPLYNNKPYRRGNSTHPNECELCECNNHSTSCVYDPDKGFGVCQSCMDNTEGDMCERCMPLAFRDSNNNCVVETIFGCDSTRVCPCVTSNASECSACDECYEEVRIALQAQRDRAYILMGRITDFAESLPAKNFSYRLGDLEATLKTLEQDVNSANSQAWDLDDRLDQLRLKLYQIRDKLNEIESLLNMANSTATSAYMTALEIESLIMDTEEKLIEAYHLLNNTAKTTLTEAQEEVELLTMLAEEAESLALSAEAEASKQEIQAERLNSTATMAYQVAMEARMKAEKAVASQEADKLRLPQLMMAVTNRSLGFDEAKSEVQNAKDQAQMAVDRADEVHARAAEDRPDFPLDELQQQLTSAEEKTSDIRNRLSYVITKFTDVCDAINDSYLEIKQLSDDIDAAADKAQNLKTRANEAYMNAKDAVAKGRGIIDEATEMLNILLNFSQLINETRLKAMEALELLDDTEKISANVTMEAQKILDDHEQAHSDSIMAVRLAEEALDIAMSALSKAQKIRDDLLLLNATAAELKSDAIDAKMEATRFNSTANYLLKNCTREKEEIDLIVSDANDAVDSQNNCSESISKQEKEVKRLREAIDGIRRLDPIQVMKLQQRIYDLRNDISDADFLSVIEQLRMERDEDKRELVRVDALMQELEQDVSDLKLAVAAGQDGCVGVGPQFMVQEFAYKRK